MSKTTLLLSVTMILAAGAANAADWGDLTMQFVYDGTPPTPDPITVTKDQAFCGKHKLVDESLVVDEKTKGIANIVVFLYVARGETAPEPHPSYAKTEKAEVQLLNKNCRYEPRVSLLRTTQTLLIGNPDTVGHNTKIDTFTNPASNYNIPAGAQLKQTFEAAERLPSPVGCSIHPWMKGWLLVKESPYFAVSDKEGKIEIKNVPAGELTFQVWQEKAGYISEVNIGGKDVEWSKGRIEVEMTKDGVDLGVAKVAAGAFED